MGAIRCINQQLASPTLSSEQVLELRADLNTLTLQLERLLDDQTNAAVEVVALTLANTEKTSQHDNPESAEALVQEDRRRLAEEVLENERVALQFQRAENAAVQKHPVPEDEFVIVGRRGKPRK
jgi:preprotein translocase subunit SecD